MVVGEIDDLAVAHCFLRHNLGVPEAVVVDEALRCIAMRLLDRDIVYIGAAALDRDDLVAPFLVLEPFAILDILP